MNLKSFISKSSSSLFSQEIDCYNAYKYLIEKRHLTEETIKMFSIGFCHEEKIDGYKYDEARDPYGHVIVPIKSEFGSVVAFAMRKPDPQEKGWWNQSFDKQNYLFMLDIAKKHIFEKNKVYIYEGYFDGIVSWQYAIKNAICLMSTNLGHRRIGFLARYCENICLCYDSDISSKAGQIAQMKSIYEMNRYGWENIYRVVLPEGIDPDEFLIQNGADSFYALEKKLSKKEIIGISKEYEQNFIRRRR